MNVAWLIDHGDPNEDAVWVNFHRGPWNSRAGCKNGRDLPGCVPRVRGCLKKIVATGILVFDFELFIGGRCVFCLNIHIVPAISSRVQSWPVFSLESLYPWWYTHFRILKSNFLSVNEDWLAFAAGASRLRIVAKSRSHRRVACTTKGRP